MNVSVALYIVNIEVICSACCFVAMMPRLIDFDWRVDIKTSSDNLSRMSVPTCILQMQVIFVEERYPT